MIKTRAVGRGSVHLLAGGGKVYSEKAARFVGTERSVMDIMASEYDKNIIKSIIEKGHEAALEFDWFLFGVEGYSRVAEIQLVRKRIASYMIKSGRLDKGGDRKFEVALPSYLLPLTQKVTIPGLRVTLGLTGYQILGIIEQWYNEGVKQGCSEEDLRYLKPQATEFKAVIGMNAHALRDWFRVRCCMRAQEEIRDMANKMLVRCKAVAPDLFQDAGPNCVRLGYCPENEYQHPKCSCITKKEAMKVLKEFDTHGRKQ